MPSLSVSLTEKALLLQLWERKQDRMAEVKITHLWLLSKGAIAHGQSAVCVIPIPNQRNAAGTFIIDICISSEHYKEQ